MSSIDKLHEICKLFAVMWRPGYQVETNLDSTQDMFGLMPDIWLNSQTLINHIANIQFYNTS